MAYTPELSEEASCTLRRIAWALNIPMTRALEKIMHLIPRIIDKEKVCNGCRDKTRCLDCNFNQENHRNGQAVINIF